MPRKRNIIDQFYYKNKNLNDACDKIRNDVKQFIERNKNTEVYLCGYYGDGVSHMLCVGCIYSNNDGPPIKYELEDQIQRLRNGILDLIYKDPWLPIGIALDACPGDDHISYMLQEEKDANNRVRNKLRWMQKKRSIEENKPQSVV